MVVVVALVGAAAVCVFVFVFVFVVVVNVAVDDEVVVIEVVDNVDNMCRCGVGDDDRA